MRWCDLEVGDVVFPLTGDMWLVASIGDDNKITAFDMLDGSVNHCPITETSFYPGVKVFRNGSLLSSDKVRSL